MSGSPPATTRSKTYNWRARCASRWRRCAACCDAQTLDQMMEGFEELLPTKTEDELRAERKAKRAAAEASRDARKAAEAAIEASVGSVGDSYDNALAETIIGL